MQETENQELQKQLIRLYKEVRHTTQRILLDAYKYYVVYKDKDKMKDDMKDDATLLYFFFPTLLMKNDNDKDAIWVEVKKLSNKTHQTLTELKDNTYLHKTYVADLLRSLRASHPQFNPVLVKEHRLVLYLNGHIGTGYVYEVNYEFTIEDVNSFVNCPENLVRKMKLLRKKLSNEKLSDDIKDALKNKMYIGVGKCIAKNMARELKELSRKMISDKLPFVFRTRVQVENNKVRIVLWIPAPDGSLINALLSQVQLPILRALILFL